MFDPNWSQVPQQLNRIGSLDDLKNVRLPRGSSAPYFFANEDIFIIRATDDYGQQLPDRAFRFEEISIEELTPVSMSRAEFNEMKEMFKYVQQFIQAQQSADLREPEKSDSGSRSDRQRNSSAEKRKSAGNSGDDD